MSDYDEIKRAVQDACASDVGDIKSELKAVHDRLKVFDEKLESHSTELIQRFDDAIDAVELIGQRGERTESADGLEDLAQMMKKNACQNFLIYDEFASTKKDSEVAAKSLLGILMGVVPPEEFRWCVDEASRKKSHGKWEPLRPFPGSL